LNVSWILLLCTPNIIADDTFWKIVKF
jgi:hypothetical protein